MAAVFSVGTGVHADVNVTLKSYLAPKKEEIRALDKIYLDGVLSGLRSYRVILEAEKKVSLFCPPPNLVLQVAQAEDILQRWAEENKSQTEIIEKAPVSLALL